MGLKLEFRRVAGVKISLTAAGDGDGLTPQAVDLLPQVAFAEVLLPDEVAAANEMLAPKAEAFQIVAQFFIVHVCPFRAVFPEKGAKKKGGFPYRKNGPSAISLFISVVRAASRPESVQRASAPAADRRPPSAIRQGTQRG